MHDDARKALLDVGITAEQIDALKPRGEGASLPPGLDSNGAKILLGEIARHLGFNRRQSGAAMAAATGFGLDGALALRDHIARTYARGEPPLAKLLEVFDNAIDASHRAGLINWTTRGLPVGKTRLGIMMPRDLAKRIRHGAVERDVNVSEFVVLAAEKFLELQANAGRP
jgi:hypothetical protein